ncbi:MAG TPA: GDP-mannose 4,6-dehydratase [Terriglobales bacterium]|jgi:CDP-paratose 2-epimerase|nr:GDP-mannose 4,6-dehydratase [Terriglobales bacterium]
MRSTTSRAVLIFGGAGFIGSNWANYLLTETNAKVHIFDNLSRPRVSSNVQWLRKVAKPGRLMITIADVRDRKSVTQAVQKADEIYHFGAQVAVTTSLEDPRSDFEVNAGGTLNILEAARESGNRPFLLFTSTNKVYGHLSNGNGASLKASGVTEDQPLDFYSPYGCSKGAADQYVRDYARIYEIPTVVFRMSCIAGPRQFGNEDQGWVAHFLYSALANKTISIYGDGRQVRDVLAVQDLLHAFDSVRRARCVTAGNVYNVGGGMRNAVSLLQVINAIEQVLQKPVRYHFHSARPGDQPIYVSDTSKLKSHVQWEPRLSVPEIIDDIRFFWKQNQSLFESEVISLRPAVNFIEALPEVAS